MSVFISWSGHRSKQVALELRSWLPNVLQAAEVWMSDVDIEAGMRGIHEIFSQLDKATVGIVCLTPENLGASWLLFEAGALSRQVNDRSRVIPYLLGLSSADVSKPLAEFQAAEADEDGTKRLVRSVNKSLAHGVLPEDKLDKAFAVWWPELSKFLNDQRRSIAPVEQQPNIAEKTVEILGSVREILRRLDQDRAYYLSPEAMKQEIAAMREVRSDFVKEGNERLIESLQDPTALNEFFKAYMKSPPVKETLDNFLEPRFSQLKSIISSFQSESSPLITDTVRFTFPPLEREPNTERKDIEAQFKNGDEVPSKD